MHKSLWIWSTLFLGAVPAAAQVVTFEELQTRDNFYSMGIQSTYMGYVWGTSLGAAQTSSTGWASATTSQRVCCESLTPVSGTAYGWNWSGPQSLFVDFMGTRAFAGGYFAHLGAGYDPHNAASIQLFGYDAAGTLIASSGALSLTDSFQYLGAGFTGIRHLEVRADRQSWFLMDDLGAAGPTSTVPEPFSMALLGTGLLGVAGVARRRRSGTEPPAAHA